VARRSITLSTGHTIPADEIEVEHARSSGPGGQNVNKTSTKVTLRFSIADSSLPEPLEARLASRLARRLTKAGEILVSCDAHREQARNLEEAYARLLSILESALVERKKRRPTRPSRGAKERRISDKRRTAAKKETRAKPGDRE
jgi:ribosome-associated protein